MIEYIFFVTTADWSPRGRSTVLLVLNRRIYLKAINYGTYTLPSESTISIMTYSHIYPSAYDVRINMILPEHVLVHIWDDNNDQVR